MKRLFPPVFCALLSVGALSAQPASAPWRTIDTAHFRVHFPAPFEAWARHAAGSLESIHERVTDFVGYSPSRPIEILVADPEAISNGFAASFLDRPVIWLWTSPPESESELGNYSDWMELVATHEIAHIVHLTRPRNRPGLVERILPRPSGPLRVNSPRWLKEGYATVVEGALTGSGRPRSSFRAMVLRRLAIEGKLPSYGALSAESGWMGGSMAYLAGSAYLEWLEEREGKGSLVRLWKRMASRRGGRFDSAFRGIFGRAPADLYDRFQAEITARAIEEEKRLIAAGLFEGEPWQRLEGGTASPQISPDGTKVLARRNPKGETFLAVWTLEESEEERKAEEARKKREEELVKDANEVAEKIVMPRPRAPRWRLPWINGFACEEPRWMPDGKRILFSRRAPDTDGVLHSDLYLWEFETGRVTRATRGADLRDADPAPDGFRAVAVHNRYGISELVFVDLTTGSVQPVPAGQAPDDSWRVWSHPRFSPDGRSFAVLLHREGRWRVAVVSSEGKARELPVAGLPFGPPAWTPDGSRLYCATDSSGVWNLAQLDLEGGSRELTRVTGGAFSPAPAPDGRSLFFLELTARGVDLRRLPLPGEPPAPLARSAEGSPILPPVEALEKSALRVEPSSPPRPYDPFLSHILRYESGVSLGADGASYQVGINGFDVVGRLGWKGLASFGNPAGPRGGAIAASWYGLPISLHLQVFSAREEPGRQRLVSQPELDEKLRGGFLEASWEKVLPGGGLRIEAGGGSSRVEALSSAKSFQRSLGSARAQASLSRTRGKKGSRLDADISGAFGRTDSASWTQSAVGARVTRILSAASLGLAVRSGRSGGSPTQFDLFALGGAPSAILPPGFDRNRIDSPALPAASQKGERFETVRAELSPSLPWPIVLYAERMRAWDPGAKPDWIRVNGLELRIDRLFPQSPSVNLGVYGGIAHVRSEAPRFESTRGYAGIIYRP